MGYQLISHRLLLMINGHLITNQLDLKMFGFHYSLMTLNQYLMANRLIAHQLLKDHFSSSSYVW